MKLFQNFPNELSKHRIEQSTPINFKGIIKHADDLLKNFVI